MSLDAAQRRALLAHPAGWIACGFGSGLSPVAPGTAGSLAALIPWFALRELPWPLYLGVIAFAFAIGTWASNVAIARLRIADLGAGSGAILAWQLRAQGGAPAVMPLPGEGATVTLSTAANLAVPLYRHAITTAFLVGTGVIACAFLLILMMPEHPLRDHHHAPAAAAD